MRKSVGLGMLAAALLLGCGSTVVNPVTGEAERTVMDEEAELAEGAKGHQGVLQEYGVLNNPALQAYVTALGNKLAAQSERSQLQWHFTVLDSPEINAFALPGGYVYVTRGLMAYMGSEADLAGVIGHEIGHVTARHGAQRATRQQTAGLGVFAATVLGVVLESQGVSGAGRLAGDLSNAAAAGYVAKYGRDQELQADGLGAAYLQRVQYDPQNMVDVIRALKDQERFAADMAQRDGQPAPAGRDWLASHPSNDERLGHITDLAAQYHGKYADEGRAVYLKAIQGLPFGDSAAQGLTRGNRFYHPGLGFALDAPPGWRIVNQSDKLVLVNAQRDAQLLLRAVPAPLGHEPAAIVRQLFKPSAGQLQPRTLNGMPASHFVGSRSTPQGQDEPLEATVVQGPQGLSYVLQWAGANPRALQRARAELQQAENSFRALTAADRQAAQAWVLKTVPLPAGGFAALAAQSPLEHAEAQLKLLNGYYSNGAAPKPGQLVKVVVAQ